MQFAANLKAIKDSFSKKNCDTCIFLIITQNIDRGYIEPVLMSTHNLCFRAKNREKMFTFYTQVLLYKRGV